jgi:hypothetical protein
MALSPLFKSLELTIKSLLNPPTGLGTGKYSIEVSVTDIVTVNGASRLNGVAWAVTITVHPPETITPSKKKFMPLCSLRMAWCKTSTREENSERPIQNSFCHSCHVDFSKFPYTKGYRKK